MSDASAPTMEGLQRQVLELQIKQLMQKIEDHETRLRIVEDVAIRFNFILYLTMGGGLLSIFNLLGIVAIIGMALYGKTP